ncbi:MAG TPA: LLM class flavin-dependent oxidoreductase [Pseudonocardiaceae bacterium]|jgi:alkanesulfonate monooxygenase SsuD/methylene tetrahydromethanopterin reductase-like flavin-dependent oxidoreductase (luciferase family)|nr:LLM class flavin-dependent oxidoreductase [Pseudonocardiaceae bacterium]
MRLGIGLPTTTPGTDGATLVEWARTAEDSTLSSLAVLDRLVYDSVEPFVALAAAAAVTRRIRLATMIAIGPLRSAGLLAKQTGSLARVSGDRFTLGLGVGARLDDYRAAEADHRTRGARLSAQLTQLRTDPATKDVELLVGGTSGAGLARMARYADGYAHGGGPPRAFAAAADRARAAWGDLGRPGAPALWGQGYFALGGAAEATAGQDYLRDYYAFTGPFAAKIAAGCLCDARAIRDFVRGYQEAGCDELVLLPTSSDPTQLHRLLEVLGE